MYSAQGDQVQILAAVNHKVMINLLKSNFACASPVGTPKRLRKIDFNTYHVSGFTLVELIVYISLITLFLTGAILFSWDVIYGREKSFRTQVVQQSARIAMAKIAYAITEAKAVQSISTNQLILINYSGPNTVVDLTTGKIQIDSGSGPIDLTSNQVIVTDLIFTNLSDPTTDSKNVKVKIVMIQAGVGIKGELSATTTVEQAIQLKGQYNQSRQLLIDTSARSLVGGTSLQGITIQNVEAPSITVDRLYADWTGVPVGKQLTQVQIGGGTLEWTGTSASGSTVDLTNFVINQADGIISSNIFTFNSDMTGAELNLRFIALDGSSTRAKVYLTGLAPTPTPTPTPTSTPTPFPTPTPPPATSCNMVCTNLGKLTGTCRKNAAACTTNGETYTSAGDQFCTGGPNADTCCCLP